MKFKLSICAIGFGCLYVLPLLALPLQSPEAIRSVVQSFLEQQVNVLPEEEKEIRVGHLDPRLQLPACQNALKAYLPDGQSQDHITTVGVRCLDTKPWNVYVPVSIHIQSPVLVSTRNISRGELIQEQDVEIAKRDRAQLRYGYYKEKDFVVGQVASQNISAGTAITQKLVEMPNIISRGQSVTLFIQVNKIQVEMKGIAQDNGYLNKTIPVLNPSSKKVVQGRVVGPGRVEVVN